MGHIAGSKNDLAPLIDRLNKYPIGLVDNPKLREILSFLFSEKEAYVASRFPLEEATLAELARLTGVARQELLTILESMADKGLVMDLPYAGTTYYLLMPGFIGFMEFTFMKNRSDLPMDKLARLMTEYLSDASENGEANEFFGNKTQLTRSLVYDDTVPVTSEITSYENARDIIKNSGFGAVSYCYCRHKKEHMGRKCKRGAPVDGMCVSLGTGAKFLSRRGFAKEKSVEELLAILERARSLNLTHITDNVREKPSFVCNCCGCCCELMHGVHMGYYDGIAKSGFMAAIDPALCDYCGACMAACNAKAIGLAKDVSFDTPSDRRAQVRQSVCLGCGACVSVCSKKAIKMIPRNSRITPPRKKIGLFMRIAWEKGKLAPFITSRAKRRLREFFSWKAWD
ncbi:Uncharacterized di-4Fe-4S ferredoxin domain-containing protein, DVU0498 type [hydrothermal vent metagenome]|uniref:Uncharacterized di-4Fe-4S ferredoxin domain-containing protein, DVU0498 type n=1 Tax=hydrothermal vent metagenome TaxID=652676 RepID=A0A3B1BRX1_9ZZZZ